MKLIGCHIENFGKLSDIDFSFSDGCHVICRENGWGKSTLAAFIKVMFFGFDNEGKRSDLENERKRYKPWQGGVYGGRLTFETDGISYTVIRTFGSKEKEDAFELRETDTNLETKKFSRNLGEELFRIDAASFERTVFLYQNQWEIATTDRIHAKLGNLAENTDDINNFDTAYKRISDWLNANSPRRKTGFLYKLQDEIRGLEEAVRGKSLLENSITETEGYLKSEKERKKQIQESQDIWQERLNILSSYQDRKLARERYAVLQEEEKNRREAMEQAVVYFPGEIPEKELLETLTRETASLPEKKKYADHFRLTDSDRQEFSYYEELFAEGIPEPEELDGQMNQAKEHRMLVAEQEKARLDASEKEQLEHLQMIFEKGVPKEEKFAEMISLWRSRDEKKGALFEKKAKKQAERETAPKKQGGSGLWIAAIALILVGIAGYFLHPAAGVILLFAAVAVLAVACVKKSKASSGDTEKQKEALALEMAGLEAEIQKIEAEVAEFLKGNGTPYQEDQALEQIYQLKGKSEQYQSLWKKQSEAEDPERIRRIEILAGEMEAFLGHFQNFQRQDSMEESIALLKRYGERYVLLLNQEENYRDAQKAWEKSECLVRDSLKRYGMEGKENLHEQIEEIREHQSLVEACRKEWLRSKEELSAFEESRDMEQLMAAALPLEEYTLEEAGLQINALADALEESTKKIHLYEDQLEDRYEEWEALLDQEEILAMKKEEFRASLEKYHRLEKTRDFLEQAKTSFTARYTEPVRKGFDKYFRLLEGKEAENCRLDANMNLTVDEKGHQREVGFFSVGYQNLYGLCMRMALVDAMYTEEKPFIVLDDPFVNLDPAKTKGGMEFLKEAGKEYQILYFTCHESRT